MNDETIFEVACLFYEICGASIQMDESEYLSLIHI